MLYRSLSFLKLDLRSLSLFRFLLGLILICDLFSRINLVPLFYTDSGLIPRSFLFGGNINSYFFSVFSSAGHLVYIYAFMAIAGICYTCLTFGYKTRFFTVLSWIFFISFSARAPMISHGGDDLIRMALFWMIFVPTNHFFSVDKALSFVVDTKTGAAKETNESSSEFSVATCALFGQLIAVYFFTALLKWHPVWTTEASAIYFSLQIDQYITPIAALMQKLPFEWTQVLTRTTLAAELIVPFLIFIPFKNSFFRWVSITVFLSFHLGLFFTFYLGTFPWICMAYWLIFIPTSTWDRLQDYFKQKVAIVFYDGNCSYCLKLTYLLKTFLILPGISIQKAQDVQTINETMLVNNSWVIRNSSGLIYTHFNGFIELLKLSPFSFLKPLLANSYILPIGNAIYKKQAAKRQLLSKLLTKLKPSPLVPKLKLVPQIFVLSFFAIAIYWCVALYSNQDRWKIVSPIDEIGSLLRLHQKWDMFAPYPWKDDGWIVVQARLVGGKSWDILSDQDVNFSKPKDFTVVFENTAIRKYLINLYNKDFSDYRLFYGRHLCSKWNSKHEGNEKADSFQIYYVLEQTPEPGKNPAIPEKRLLWDHYCFAKPLN